MRLLPKLEVGSVLLEYWKPGLHPLSNIRKSLINYDKTDNCYKLDTYITIKGNIIIIIKYFISICFCVYVQTEDRICSAQGTRSAGSKFQSTAVNIVYMYCSLFFIFKL